MFTKIIILSGGFDPVHKGHVRMFKAAQELGKVIIGLNSDDWLVRKKNKYFMSYDERYEILSSIKYVDNILSFDDSDNTAIKLIKNIIKQFSNHDIYFGNGGDRTNSTTPEVKFCNNNNIKLLWNLGGTKIQSSSSLLKKW